MYLRAVHAEPDTAALQQFIRAHPFGLLVTALPSEHHPTIQCTHIPWVLEEASDTPLGCLRGHLARANPHARALLEAVAAADPAGSATDGPLAAEVSVVFTGPADAYVTPQFYVDTKPATGKVVPTWNYAAVQAYGTARIYGDAHGAAAQAWLQRQVERLTDHAERHVLPAMGAAPARPWAVGDAPDRYIDAMKKAIVGIEITIERLEGKFKMSQEMGAGDRAGVRQGFEALGTEQGAAMAHVVAERSRRKDGPAASA